MSIQCEASVTDADLTLNRHKPYSRDNSHISHQQASTDGFLDNQ